MIGQKYQKICCVKYKINHYINNNKPNYKVKNRV